MKATGLIKWSVLGFATVVIHFSMVINLGSQIKQTRKNSKS